MDYLLIALAGITNGIIFAPASEHIYYFIFIADGPFSPLSLVFTVFNTIGHIGLFYISRWFIRSAHLIKSNISIVMTLKRKFVTILDQGNDLFDQFDSKYRSVLFLRCVPFFHSAISIMVATTNISIRKFVGYTLLGNILFLIIINLLVMTVGDVLSSNIFTIITGLLIITILSVILQKIVHGRLNHNSK